LASPHRERRGETQGRELRVASFEKGRGCQHGRGKEQRRADGPAALEEELDFAFEGEADRGRGERRHGYERDEPEPTSRAAGGGREYRFQAPTEIYDDRERRRDVQRDLEQYPRRFNSQIFLRQDEMPRRRDGQKFRQALDQTQRGVTN